MVYGLLADVVMVTHFAFIVFLPVGALLTWRWPRLVWVYLPTAVYGLMIIMVGFPCPLTPLERSLRVRAGERAFTGGFVDHYIEGVIYPQQYAGLIRGLVVVLMVVGYAGLAVRLRRRALVARPQRQDRADEFPVEPSAWRSGHSAGGLTSRGGRPRAPAPPPSPARPCARRARR